MPSRRSERAKCLRIERLPLSARPRDQQAQRHRCNPGTASPSSHVQARRMLADARSSRRASCEPAKSRRSCGQIGEGAGEGRRHGADQRVNPRAPARTSQCGRPRACGRQSRSPCARSMGRAGRRPLRQARGSVRRSRRAAAVGNGLRYGERVVIDADRHRAPARRWRRRRAWRPCSARSRRSRSRRSGSPS